MFDCSRKIAFYGRRGSEFVSMKIKIKVRVNQPKTEVIEKGDIWKVNVKAKPEKNEANRELIKFFSKLFKKKVRIVKGLKSKEKTLEIT